MYFEFAFVPGLWLNNQGICAFPSALELYFGAFDCTNQTIFLMAPHCPLLPLCDKGRPSKNQFDFTETEQQANG
jgi:hypothetical protein